MDEQVWESRRAAVLAELDLLDSPQAEQFRSLAALAAAVCGMPMAAVSLVDQDRQFFAGAFGLGFRQTEREASFCAHAILDPGRALLVPDATKDRRFQDSRLVTGDPYVRAYAGIPLVTPEGVPLGALCVLDAAPRQLSAEQLASLGHLAVVAVDLLQAQRTNRALARALHERATADSQRDAAVEEFRSAFEHAPIGMTISSVQGTYLQVNAAFAEALGRAPASLVGGTLLDLTAPDDQPPERDAVGDLLERGHGSALLERTFLGANGRSHPALVTVSLVRPPDSPTLLLEHIEFITERRRAETQLLETQSAVDAIISVDSENRIVSWNRGAERMFGHDRAAVLTQPLSAIIREHLPTRHESGHPESGRPESGLRRASAGGEPRPIGSTIEVSALRADGTELIVELSLSTWRVGDGQPHYTAVVRDITTRVSAEARSDLLRVAAVTANSAATLAAAAPAVIEAVCSRLGWLAGHAWYTDETRADWHVAEHTHDHAPGQEIAPGETDGACPLRELAARGSRPSPDHHPVDAGIVIDSFPVASTDPTFEVALRRCHIGAAVAVPLRAGDTIAGVLAFYLPTGIDTTDPSLMRDLEQVGTLLGRVVERESLARLHAHQALHDPLTELANRRRLVEEIQIASTEDGSAYGEKSALCFIDLDRFRLVNDSLGHTAGDGLLREAARRLSAVTRPVDTVARLGGDEFVVLVRGLVDQEAAQATGQRLLRAVEGPAELDGHLLHLSASVGVAILDSRYHADPQSLLRDADAALRRAKNLGGGNTQVFDVALRRDTVRRLEDETALRGAVEGGQLRLRYQLVVDVRTGAPSGAEALLRWQRPGRGLVPPGDFIALAEETGLIIELGHWALMQACTDAAQWASTVPDLAHGCVSVNVSARQLVQPGFVRDLYAILAHTSLPPRRLMLEITESVLLENTSAILEVLEAVTRLGVRLALDDFGTGYSSLSYVQHLPAHVLKLDKSFVDPIRPDGSGTALAEVVIKLAHAVGMRTVAEGVEHRHQADALGALGCGLAQGYLFARPVPLQQLTQAITAADQCPRAQGRDFLLSTG